MKRSLLLGSALAAIALATPCFAAIPSSPYGTANGAGYISMDNGLTRIAFNVSLVARAGRASVGSILINSEKGPFRGVISAKPASCLFSTSSLIGSPTKYMAIMHTDEFWYCDLSRAVVGNASTIKYIKAFADIQLVRDGSNSFVGFAVYRASDHVLLASSNGNPSPDPVKTIAGSVTITPM